MSAGVTSASGVPEYDDFVDTFVSAVKRRWPHVLLQWEDFAGVNAARFLERYRDQLCTFNDDIQGTAAVATGTLLSAITVTGIPLSEQRVAFLGFGGAGLGIAQLIWSVMRDAGLSEQEAYERFYAVDRYGLLVEGGQGSALSRRPLHAGSPRWPAGRVANPTEIGLLDVIRNAKPTVLIGVSGQAGAFTEEVIRTMAKNTERPVIFPLSNPTSRCEATPQQVLDWTDGRALIGTGSPFGPANFNGKEIHIDQTNNSYIFPGLALGTISSKARHVSDAMIKASAIALAGLAPTKQDKNANLLPPLGIFVPLVSRLPKRWANKQFRMVWHPSMKQSLNRSWRPMFGNRSMNHTSEPSDQIGAAYLPKAPTS